MFQIQKIGWEEAGNLQLLSGIHTSWKVFRGLCFTRVN